MVMEYAGTPLVVQTDGSAKKRVATAGFVVFLPSGKELVPVGQTNAGSTNNEAKLVAVQ